VDVLADPCPAGRLGEPLRRGQRMPALALHGQVGEVRVHVEKRCAGNVTLEVELAASVQVPELPAAVDELVAHGPIVTTAASGGVYGETPRRLT
jgi:hypothetical protein